VIEPVVVTWFPLAFLTVLFGGGELYRRRDVDMDGEAPIDRTLFYASKYSVVILWAGMVAQAWGAGLALVAAPGWLKGPALCLWAAGFALLFSGRVGLGDLFRLGSPKESARFREGGLFRFSRNPMYLGVYATLLASVLYTLNPVLCLLAIFVVVVHHRIVLAEEQYLRSAFGAQYADYCRRVRRYL
jgi:protein-S-isoprenylcysteine O-methyltransferase Ste14